MKKCIPLFGSFCALLIFSACSTEVEENAAGWTFCSCNTVQSDLKSEIAREMNEEERTVLEIELEITEKECGDFLLKEGASQDEFKEHMRKKEEECR